MTGYGIKKHVKTRLNAVTSASYGTLYPTLHKLLEEGAVEVDEVPQTGRPAKKVYKITPAGRDELDMWLKQPPAMDQVKREFLLKLYFSKDLPLHQLRTLITYRRSEVQTMLDALQSEDFSKEDASTPHQTWVMDYVLSLYQAEMDWLRQLEAEIGVA